MRVTQLILVYVVVVLCIHLFVQVTSLDDVDFPSSDSDDPFLYAESHGPIELTLDEASFS
jgi:hypothetical protein